MMLVVFPCETVLQSQAEAAQELDEKKIVQRGLQPGIEDSHHPGEMPGVLPKAGPGSPQLQLPVGLPHPALVYPLWCSCQRLLRGSHQEQRKPHVILSVQVDGGMSFFIYDTLYY